MKHLVAAAFGVGSLPRMYVIDREGRILYQGYPLEGEEIERLLGLGENATYQDSSGNAPRFNSLVFRLRWVFA